MLRLRICPNCQEEIRSQKAYFCHRCGTEPPPPRIEETPPVEIESRVEDKPVRKRRLAVVVTGRSVGSSHSSSTKVAVALCVLLSLAAAGISVYYFRTNLSRPSLPSLPSAPKNEVFVADIGFEVENHPFSAKGLSEIVPADVDLYLESIDPEILLPSLVSDENWSEVESFVSDQLGLNVSEATSFLEDEFAVVQESTASAFLARAKDVDFLEQKASEVGECECLPAGRQGWQAKMVNGFLVVSNSSELIHAIEEARKKLTLNLSLTSGFAEARKKLPQTGQIFVYGEKRLDFIPDSVKGEAFVIAKKDNGVLITGL